MSVAIISYDKNLLDKLPETDEIKTYDDTLSLIKDYQDNIKTIVYDSSSGIFAEDDLKYLVDKLVNANIKYFALTVPENPINESLFGNNVVFTPKSEFFNILPDILKDIQQDKNQQEEISKHEEDNINQNTYDLTNFEPDIISIEEKLLDDKGSISNRSQTQLLPEVEYGNIEYGDILINNKSNLNMGIEKELESFKEDAWFIEETIPALSINESLLQSNYSDFIESNEFYFEEKDKAKELQNLIEHKEEDMKEKELILEEPIIEHTVQKTENSLLAETESKIAAENTIANFSITISSEDIKKLAMEVAKDMLKNDSSLQTMIDHLQIDFQNEAMKELEEIKNQIFARMQYVFRIRFTFMDNEFYDILYL